MASLIILLPLAACAFLCFIWWFKLTLTESWVILPDAACALES